MFRISIMLLKRRKLFTCIIISVIAVSAMLYILSNLVAQSIQEDKLEKAYETYGRFSCTAARLSAQELENVYESLDEHAIGFYELYGTADVDDMVLTLGYADENFVRITNIKLLEGRMPEAPDEIAAERFAAEALEDMEKFKIVGIIDNYSADLSMEPEIIKGENDGPNIIFAEDNIYKGTKAYKSVVLDLREQIDPYADSNEIYEITEKAGLPSEKVYWNENLVNKGMEGCFEIRTLNSFFTKAIMLGGVFCCWSLLSVFYKDYKKKLAVINVLGGKQADAAGIAAWQMFVFIGAGSLAGMLLSYLFYKGIIVHAFEHMAFRYPSGQIGRFLIWEAVLCMVSAAKVFLIRRELKGSSIAENLKNKRWHFMRKGREENEKMIHINTMQKIRLPKIKATVLFSAVFVICYFSVYIFHLYQEDYTAYPDYELHYKNMSSSEVVNGFRVEVHPGTPISKEDVKELQRYGDRIRIRSIPYFKSYSLLFQEENIPEYFRQWNDQNQVMWEDTDAADSVIRKNWPAEAEGAVMIREVDFIVADDRKLSALINQYNLNLTTGQLREQQGAIIFLPEGKGSEESLKIGQPVTIGGVSRYDDRAIYEDSELKTAGIVKDNYRFQEKNMEEESDHIVIVMGETTAEGTGLFSGYESLEIYVDEADAGKRKEIDDTVYKIAGKIQGGAFWAKKVRIENETVLGNYSRILGGSLICMNLVFGMVCIIIMLYQMLLRKQQEFGILRVLGAGLKTVLRSLHISYGGSFAIACLLGSIFTFSFIGDVQEYFYNPVPLIMSFVQTGLFFVMSCFVTGRMIKRTGIRQMIEEG